MVTVSNLIPKQIVEAISVYKVTTVPLNYAVLNCLLKATIEPNDVISITQIIGKGCPSDHNEVKHLIKIIPPDTTVHQIYSSAEISGSGLISQNDENMSSIGTCVYFTECKVI